MPRNAAMWNPICAPKSPLGAIRVEIQANRCVKRGGTSKKHEENGKMVTILCDHEDVVEFFEQVGAIFQPC